MDGDRGYGVRQAVARRIDADAPHPAGVAHGGVPPLALAVIVPVLNESGNVPRLIASLDRVLTGFAWEVIFVDDGSRDGTPEVVAHEASGRRDVRLIRRYGRRGLSTAVIEGMLSTTAPIVAVMDGDLQHDDAILPELVRAVAEGEADVAVGTRYGGGGSVGEWDRGRVRASAVATRLAHLVIKTPLSDPMSGFFCLRQSTLLTVLPSLSTIGFKILLDILMSSPGRLRVVEVPYRFRTRVAGESKLDASVAIDYLLLLVEKLTRRWIPPRLLLFGAVGAFGLVAHLVVLKGLITLGHLSFDHAQMVAVAITIALNFVMNNILTYRDRQLHGIDFWRGLASFYLVCGLGAAANVAVGDLVYARHSPWWAAGVAGAAISYIWNYTASSIFTWRRS